MIRRAASVTLAGAALTLLAFTFDASPLFVPGVAFAALGIVAPATVWLSARGARVRRHLPVQRVVEQQPVEATIEVRRGLLALPAVIVDSLADEPISLRGAQRAVTVRVVARFERRGLRRLPPPSLIVHDPLHLAEATPGSTEPPQELLVLPRTEPVSWLQGAGTASSERTAAMARAEALAAVEMDGLRPYRVGTPASRIHWSALARGAGLLERRLRPDGDSRPLVVLDARGSEPEAALDAAVRAAASLVLELARTGGSSLLLPGERRAIQIDPELAGWGLARVRLALIQGGPDSPPPVLRSVRLGQVFYVAARPLSALPAAFLGGGGSMILLPHSIASSMPARPVLEVAGCAGFAVAQRSPRARGHASRGGLARESVT